MAAEKYYVSEVDLVPNGIYCYHDIMGEVFIPTHTHIKGQFLYTEGGTVYVRTEKKTFFLPARHFMWIASGTSHSIHPSSLEVVMRNLYFPIDEHDESFFYQTAIYPVDDLLLNMMMYTARWKGNIFPDEEASYTILRAFKFLLAKSSKHALPLALPLVNDSRLRQVVEHLDQNTGKEIFFSDLADKFGFSPRTLSRLFQKELNMSFIQYFTILRMLTALQLLLDKNLSVNEVATKIGYSSMPTFSNTFHKLIGLRPSEYVKLKNVL